MSELKVLENETKAYTCQ